jgi:bifunctional DNase/RNase
MGMVATLSPRGLTRSLAVAAVALAATSTAAPAPPGAGRPSGPQEAEVIAVVLDPRTSAPTVLLQGKRDGRRLAMAIGPAEATGIAVPLQGVKPPRPLTHDLFLTVFGRLSIAVDRVVIHDLRDNIYYATVHLRGGPGPMELDARPSDAIALAVRAGAPVLVEDRVFDKSRDEEPASPSRSHI